MTTKKSTSAQGTTPAQSGTTPAQSADSTPSTGDPVRDAVITGLGWAAKLAALVAAAPIPYAALVAGIVGGVLAVTKGIVERWGLQGAAAAKTILEELAARGPQGITDAELADDDAALEREIHGWYPAQAAEVQVRIDAAGVLPANPYAPKPYPLVAGVVNASKADGPLAPRVRAKFRCVGAAKSGDGIDVRLVAVTANNADNESWSRWTPSGELSMFVTNPSVFEAFVVGEEYFLDFTPAKS